MFVRYRRAHSAEHISPLIFVFVNKKAVSDTNIIVRYRSEPTRTGLISLTFMVRSAGVEPTLSAPEANVLSTGLRAHIFTASYRRLGYYSINLKFLQAENPLSHRITF